MEHLTNRAVNPGRTEVVILGDNSVEAFEERPRESMYKLSINVASVIRTISCIITAVFKRTYKLLIVR